MPIITWDLSIVCLEPPIVIFVNSLVIKDDWYDRIWVYYIIKYIKHI